MINFIRAGGLYLFFQLVARILHMLDTGSSVSKRVQFEIIKAAMVWKIKEAPISRRFLR